MQIRVSSLPLSLLSLISFVSAVPAPVPGDTQTAPGAITYYDVAAGLTACGSTYKGTDLVAALPSAVFGSQSNGNPKCGKGITLTVGGKSVKVKVVDKCGGCGPNDVDLSEGAFEKLGSKSAGRIHGMTWKWD